jgi:hypothetical protein
MSRAPRSVKFTDLRHFAWAVQIGHRFRFGRLRAGELKITNLVILDRARGAGVGLVRTDTVSVLADVEPGDRARRAKEKGKGGKPATIAVLRRGCDRQNEQFSDFGRAEGRKIDNLSIMGHSSGKLVTQFWPQ